MKKKEVENINKNPQSSIQFSVQFAWAFCSWKKTTKIECNLIIKALWIHIQMKKKKIPLAQVRNIFFTR